jgi:acyl-coenzyme A synthetase/AMP-(fatty) acid ligase
VVRALAIRLGSHRTPTDVFVLDDLPLNRNGKADRRELLRLLRPEG